ncbi:hypothetical protein COCOBI_08-6240 [Coccomyxa sp. Obi]|nr:hypothetical protein COCOBI_08-6240 [Coccomyxa sp. Obi]
MGGFRELAALTTNGVNGVGTSEPMVPPGQLRSLGKRKRTGPGQLQMRAPCADSLEGIRSAYEGFDTAAARWLAAVAEREAGVTVREAACCGVQAQLAARSAELTAREGCLADWDARLRDWDARLQRMAAHVKEQEERLNNRLLPSHLDKENSTPEDTDSDLDVTGGPGSADEQPGEPGWRMEGSRAPTAWPASLDFSRYWEPNVATAATSRPEEQKFNSAQPSAAQSPALQIAPLSCGVRIVRAETAAAAGSPRAAATAAAAVSAESPSECSAGAADLFPYDTMHAALGSYHHQASGLGSVRDVFSPPGVTSSEARAEQRMQLPLFHHQQQQGGPGQLLESLAEAAEEVERRAGGAVGPGSAAARPRAAQPQPEQSSGLFAKTLDYKSCDHIMCLTKDMARHLFPQPPHTSAGGPSQMSVELEDDSGRLWPMTYRCVPHRYSYELRAGWKAFAAFWAVGVGDTVTLWRDESSGSLRISVHAASALHGACPAAGTRGRPGVAA